MNKFTKLQLEGAQSLISDGLKLAKNQTLVLLYQKDLSGAADCIKAAAKRLEVRVEEREFNREDFFHGYPKAFAPDKLRTNYAPAGITLLIEWSEETTKWRLALLKELMNQPQQWRIASMPGVDLKGLASCISDFRSIEYYCLMVFAVLARSNKALLRTPNPNGGYDELQIPIRSRLPILSTGEISPSTWGNFPSGETFIVPDPYRAEGSVTIRGSIPRRPLRSQEWVRFEVKRGRIQHSSIEASSTELRKEFTDLFFSKKGRVKCVNANSLAELGIGTNDRIERLTGKPIFDEKKIGTVHIAFGRNDQFHGPLDSCLHHDLVCTNSSLVVQTKLTSYDVVKDGKFSLQMNGAVRHLDKFGLTQRTNRRVKRGETKYEVANHSGVIVLSIKYATTRGDIPFVVAKGSSASIARELLESTNRGTASLAGLIKKYSAARRKEMARRIIGGMLEYGLLKEVR